MILKYIERLNGLSSFSSKLVVIILFLVSLSMISTMAFSMAADCQVEPSAENYIGVRYKAFLVEDELSKTG